MTTTMNALRVSQVIRADRERLFRAWTDPAELVHWWRMEENGWSFGGATIDLRVGGQYRLGMTNPEGKTHVAVGEYREIDPPQRLAFTWDWDDPESALGETLVTVEFNDAGAGATEVVLTHERFADSNRVSRHEQGWMQLLRLLSRAVEEKKL